jgi:hypothetical protein
MTQEELLQEVDNLKKRVEELEKKAIQVNLSPTEKENIKNALFEGYFQSDQTVPNVSATAPYLKVIWKNKLIYIPFHK